MPEQVEFVLRNWVEFNPLVDDNAHMKLLETLDKGRQIYHFKSIVNVWGASDRSMIQCSYPIGSIDTTGKFEMVTASKGNRTFIDKYAERLTKDVICDSIIDYWRVEPRIEKETGRVIGSRVCQLNIFDPKGNIPKYVVSILAGIAAKPLTRL